ncbi:N,N'-diacetyllegionaminic acid synthase [Rubripirellula lacrimiformis]|uniref:N,N'-diacetyllegionaminic acid synthase n=1 Tax=Rubripirellula lacrimiformis TaxID=1930273 RepID=A0A517N8P0_9BACT|nr:N-acetylneuraminate synthase [Rubripirellula lacrimiformis]QDT03504.1 N,N'-diacetyllegionaminic acid synthase [Rubripirellula lacrimiformis]
MPPTVSNSHDLLPRSIVIAEAGVNHNGDLNLAMQLIDAAAGAGADYVKFQTFIAAELVTQSAPKAQYQSDNDDTSDSQLQMLKKLELSAEDHHRLIQHCVARQIKFLSTGFDLASEKFLDGMSLDWTKIPSGEITNVPYLRRMGSANRPILLSTGMATLAEVDYAIEVLESSGADRSRIITLHCTTQYPTPYEEVNLRAMQTMGCALGTRWGYSDHTLGIEIPIAAVALGAIVIEKHFTLDRKLPGPDHAASLEPDELKQMVASIRHVESALGDGIKRPSVSEVPNRPVARKSIVAATGIRAGETFGEHNLTVKRPGTGISPTQWDQVVGRVAQRDYQPDEQVQW